MMYEVCKMVWEKYPPLVEDPFYVYTERQAPNVDVYQLIIRKITNDFWVVDIYNLDNYFLISDNKETCEEALQYALELSLLFL